MKGNASSRDTAGLVRVCGVLFLTASVLRSQSCEFDLAALSYRGTALEQAGCLLRSVTRYGRIAGTPTSVPEQLGAILGEAFVYPEAAIRALLTRQNTGEMDVGGPLLAKVSRARNNSPSAPIARYFVIHDTSSPYYDGKPFPADINSPGWTGNDVERYRHSPAGPHVFVTRAGSSVTARDMAVASRATKFEMEGGISMKGLFVHVELIQPRRRDAAGPPGNDAIAPEPGFTDPQLRRLALIYIAASARAGHWLVPAYHAVLDAGLSDAHDDPQNFDLRRWCEVLGELLQSIRSDAESGLGDNIRMDRGSVPFPPGRPGSPAQGDATEKFRRRPADPERSAEDERAYIEGKIEMIKGDARLTEEQKQQAIGQLRRQLPEF